MRLHIMLYFILSKNIIGHFLHFERYQYLIWKLNENASQLQLSDIFEFLIGEKKSLLKITSFCNFSAKNIWSLFVQFKLIWHHFSFVFHFKSRKRSVTTHPIRLLQFCTMLAKQNSAFRCQLHTYWNTHLMF